MALGDLKPLSGQMIPQNSHSWFYPAVIENSVKNSRIRIVIRIANII